MTPLKPDEVRPLPSRPDVEWERERARRLVHVCGEKLKLDEAQLLIARGYGFETWEKLEHYYATWELHARCRSETGEVQMHAESAVRNLLREYEKRQQFSVQPPDISGRGASLCRYIPRFYGLTDQEIFSSTLTVAEAEFVVARGAGFNSWSELRAAERTQIAQSDTKRARSPRNTHPERQPGMPVTFASVTNGDTDQERIARLFTDDRRMFKPIRASSPWNGWIWREVFAAIAGLPNPQATLEWIGSLGADVQGHLNYSLLGDMIPREKASMTRTLLQFGADPNWVAPNGFSVLEHAVVRYGCGEAIDLIVERVKPRIAFWIAAGLGDVDMLQSFFQANGDLSIAARQDRPDFRILGNIQLEGTARPYASELHVMWEAFMIAVMSSRVNVIVALLDRGLPVDFTPFALNALHYCIEYHLDEVAKVLLSRGGNPDFKAWPDQQSPREMAKWWLDHFPNGATAQTIFNHATT